MFKIIRGKDCPTHRWSGGTTKALYIYPEHADYGKRNFLFRISIATTETETSTFTSLPGISRVLSILAGTLHIEHQGHHSATLSPFSIDHFDGSWVTTATGQVTDFNLMLQDCSGDFVFTPIEKELIIKHDTASILFVYCIKGPVCIGHETLQSGDLLLTNQQPLSLTAQEAKVFQGWITPGT